MVLFSGLVFGFVLDKSTLLVKAVDKFGVCDNSSAIVGAFNGGYNVR